MPSPFIGLLLGALKSVLIKSGLQSFLVDAICSFAEQELVKDAATSEQWLLSELKALEAAESAKGGALSDALVALVKGLESLLPPTTPAA